MTATSDPPSAGRSAARHWAIVTGHARRSTRVGVGPVAALVALALLAAACASTATTVPATTTTAQPAPPTTTWPATGGGGKPPFEFTWSADPHPNALHAALVAHDPAFDACEPTYNWDHPILVIVRVHCEITPGEFPEPVEINIEHPVLRPEATFAEVNATAVETVADAIAGYLQGPEITIGGTHTTKWFRAEAEGGVVSRDGRYVSMIVHTEWPWGGSHNMRQRATVNVDLTTGQTFDFADLFLDLGAGIAAVDDFLATDQDPEWTLAGSDQDPDDPDFDPLHGLLAFRVTDDGLTLVFNCGFGYCGGVWIDIPAHRLADVLDPAGPAGHLAQPTPDTVFDVENATFDVRCPGGLGSGVYPYRATFVDGDAVDHIFEPHGSLRVREEAVAELFADSPGPEVVARVDCWGGGSGTSVELQVFAGDTTDARRLGSIIELRTFEYVIDDGPGSPGMLVTRGWDWAPGDPSGMPSIRRTYDTRWTGDDWEETLRDEWTETPP